jgi:Zn-finger domain-containing protein
MRQKAAPLFERIASAIARHKTAQAALDAFPGPEDYPKHLRNEEGEALYELAFTPCASDAEFLEKLRYLYAQS